MNTTYDRMIESLKGLGVTTTADQIKESLSVCTDNEKKVLAFRFGFDSDGYTRTYDEVSKKTDLTRERVQQILSKALRKLIRHLLKKAG